jgi:heme exporter protein B
VIRILGHIVAHDVRLTLRQGTDVMMILMFFTIATTLFPLGVGPEPNILMRMAPGVLWVCALLSAVLSLDHVFQNDFDDGSLDLLALTPAPLVLIVLAKTIAHWLVTGLPLILAAPVLALLLNFPEEGYTTLFVAMALGTPCLSLIGAVGAALTLGARRGGALIALLVLPLYIPVLIFAVAAIDAAISGLPAKPHLLILAAILAAALPLAPWAATAAIRQALD